VTDFPNNNNTVDSYIVKCMTCEAVIQSKHRHDFVMCDCDYKSDTSIYVDGGTAYFRMGAGKNAQYEILNENN
jgi:hypothetical protein